MRTSTEALRTPEDRFADLPGFPYQPNYAEDLQGYEGLRVAYLDEGPRAAETAYVCLHGEPTWSYLYRKMIPVFVGSGARVIAPDFLGFGRSDKPVDDGAYSFDFHRNVLLRLIERLDPKGLILVVQDWGGLIGLTLPLDPDVRARLKGLLVMNTTIATGDGATEGFLGWRAFAAANPDLAVGALMRRGASNLSDREAAAYDAPFPDVRYKAGVRAFPRLVMTEPDMPGVELSRAAAKFWTEDWEGPSFMAYGAQDPVFPPEHMEALRARIRGCPPAMVVREAGHFVQEWGGSIAQAAVSRFNI